MKIESGPPPSLESSGKGVPEVSEGPMRGLSVIIPCYRSATILPALIERLQPVLESLAVPYQVILVNDCSPDDTRDVIDRLMAAHSFVSGTHLMRNFGQHNALLCGIRQASFDTIVTMDDDLQHPPEEIPRLLAALEQGSDVVYGTPAHERHSLWRAVASRLIKLALQQAVDAKTAGQVSAFRAFRTDLRDAFVSYQSSFVSIDALLTWGTNRFTAIPVQHDNRKVGQSNYTFGRLLMHAFTMITAFTVMPLRFATWVGFVCTLLGIGLLLYVLVTWIRLGSVVPGFASLACMVSLFAGAQLCCLGIIGEYMARVHSRLMDRPPYVVQRRSSGGR